MVLRLRAGLLCNHALRTTANQIANRQPQLSSCGGKIRALAVRVLNHRSALLGKGIQSPSKLTTGLHWAFSSIISYIIWG